jgi:spore coat protein CotF
MFKETGRAQFCNPHVINCQIFQSSFSGICHSNIISKLQTGSIDKTVDYMEKLTQNSVNENEITIFGTN